MRYYTTFLMAALHLLLIQDSVLANTKTPKAEAKAAAVKVDGRVVSTATSAETRQGVDLPQRNPQPKALPAVIKVSVNLSTQRMHVYEHGKLKYTWRVSSGRGRYRTPNGNYKPTWMSRMHYSKQYYNSPMPHSIFFHRGYAIHGTGAVRQLGRPASHGCVRLHPSNARRLFRMVRKYGKKRTKITVHGVTPKVRYRKRRYARRYKKKYKSFWPFSF